MSNGMQSSSGAEVVDDQAVALWKPDYNYIRLFISHRDEDKSMVADLAKGLETYGISCFVAHDDIRAARFWPTEIELALKTMEIMLPLVTENFHKSSWTNQEIGYAQGRGIQIIPLKLGDADPQGFIANIQAIKTKTSNPADVAKEIFDVLFAKDDFKKRGESALVHAFVNPGTPREAEVRFKEMNDRIENLSEDNFKIIQEEFTKVQLWHIGVRQDLDKFLMRAGNYRLNCS